MSTKPKKRMEILQITPTDGHTWAVFSHDPDGKIEQGAIEISHVTLWCLVRESMGFTTIYGRCLTALDNDGFVCCEEDPAFVGYVRGRLEDIPQSVARLMLCERGVVIDPEFIANLDTH